MSDVTPSQRARNSPAHYFDYSLAICSALEVMEPTVPRLVAIAPAID